MSLARIVGAAIVLSLVVVGGDRVHTQQPASSQPFQFHLLEATIADVHRGIQEGQLTCRALVQAYINRARAYNGTCNQLVTEDDGAEVSARTTPNSRSGRRDGRAAARRSRARRRRSNSDGWSRPRPIPTVQQQFGMTVGIPNAGQVRALGMLNIRGERSVTCKGDFDRHPSAGPLPPGAPAVCEEFRQQPDALERAAELDAQYGRNPDLQALPMYCIPFSFKDPVRSEGHAVDRRRRCRDTTSIFRRATRRSSRSCARRAPSSTPRRTPRSTTGAGRAIPGGKNYPTKVLPSTLGYQRSTLGRQSVQLVRHDARRIDRVELRVRASRWARTSSCAACARRRASRAAGPANHNSVALILPHKAHLSFLGGAIGAEIYNDRAGIHCRTIADAVKVLDALKDPVNGYYDPRDIFTTVPRSSVSDRAVRARRSPMGGRARSRACASASSASSWSSTRRSTSRSSTRPRPK